VHSPSLAVWKARDAETLLSLNAWRKLCECSGRRRSSGNGIIQKVVGCADEVRLLMLRELEAGRRVPAAVDGNMSFAELVAARSPQLFLSLLHTTGYIAKAGKVGSGRDFLKNPNHGVHECFDKRISWCSTDCNPVF